jgi:hypothetical protein
MKALLTMCTLVGAMLSPPGAWASGRTADPLAQTDTGFLNVGSTPAAHVIIDDADTKTVTPQPHLELKVGHHTLTLVTLDGARKRTLGFKVEPGQTTTLTIVLTQPAH